MRLSSTRFLLVLAAVIAVTLASGAGVARAQDARQQGPHREGLMLGFSLGGGSFEVACEMCPEEDDRFEGGALTLHIGGMLGPRLAILGESWIVHHKFEILGIFDASLVATFNTVAARLFLNPKLWLQGGLGGALVTFYGGECDDAGECESESAFAMVFAAGYELYQGVGFAIDVELRGGIASGDAGSGNMSSLQVGFSWY